MRLLHEDCTICRATGVIHLGHDPSGHGGRPASALLLDAQKLDGGLAGGAGGSQRLRNPQVPIAA